MFIIFKSIIVIGFFSPNSSSTSSIICFYSELPGNSSSIVKKMSTCTWFTSNWNLKILQMLQKTNLTVKWLFYLLCAGRADFRNHFQQSVFIELLKKKISCSKIQNSKILINRNRFFHYARDKMYILYFFHISLFINVKLIKNNPDTPPSKIQLIYIICQNHGGTKRLCMFYKDIKFHPVLCGTQASTI